MPLSTLIEKIKLTPDSVSFGEVIAAIEENYLFTATAFTNGSAVNELGTNEGSCKIFYFAQLNELSVAQTLACFGDYYRKDVLENPEGSDHANIRNFIQHGWTGINFNDVALKTK